MTTGSAVVIKIIEVFLDPIPIIYGSILAAPDVIPYHTRYWVYLPNGETRTIVLIGQMMSLEKAWRRNVHGFGYQGAIIQPADIEGGDAFISNVSYPETINIYRNFRGIIAREV